MGERYLQRSDISEVLPHGPQFMFLETAEVVEPGKRAKGTLADRSRFSYLADHFPGYPVFPGALQMEALAELSGIAFLSGLERQEDKIGILVEDHMKYRIQVVPEDHIELEAEIIGWHRRFVGLAKSAVAAKKDGKIVAQGEITIALIDKPKPPKTNIK